MQPLPPAITTQVLTDAAATFERAATQLGTPESAATLARAASLTYQGIPSLRMTTVRDSGSREAIRQLEAAAAAAHALSKEITATPGGDFSAHRDAVLGWAELATNAAFLLPAPYVL